MWFIWLNVGIVLGFVIAALLNSAREAQSSAEFSGEPRPDSAR